MRWMLGLAMVLAAGCTNAEAQDAVALEWDEVEATCQDGTASVDLPDGAVFVVHACAGDICEPASYWRLGDGGLSSIGCALNGLDGDHVVVRYVAPES